MRIRTGLVLSVLVHIGLVIWLLQRYEVLPKDTIQFEIVETQALPTPSHSPTKGPSLKNLQPDGDVIFSPGTQDFTSDPYQNGGWSKEMWGSSGGDFKQIEYEVRFQRLQAEIQGLLNYPGILGRRSMTATVNARLAFDKTGNCNWDQTRIEAAQPYFRVYILSLMKKLCGFDTISQIGFKENQAVDLSFDFQLSQATITSREMIERDRINGNVLSFTRYFPSSALEYKLGPIRGVWFAPVVYLDNAWILEKWDEYVNGRDPLDEFR